MLDANKPHANGVSKGGDITQRIAVLRVAPESAPFALFIQFESREWNSKPLAAGAHRIFPDLQRPEGVLRFVKFRPAFALKLNCNILHLEDDDNDAFFFQRALQAFGFAGAYGRVTSVEQAILYLCGDGKYADRSRFPVPDVLVMDSTVGHRNAAMDLLEWMSRQKGFQHIVKIALTGDMNPAAAESMRALGVTEFLSKGSTVTEFNCAVHDALQRCLHSPKQCE